MNNLLSKEDILKELKEKKYIKMSKNNFGRIMFNSNFYTEEIRAKVDKYFQENKLKYKQKLSMPSDSDIIYKEEFDISKI